MSETPEDVYREPVEDLYPEGRTACDSRDCQFVHDHSRPATPEDVRRAVEAPAMPDDAAMAAAGAHAAEGYPAHGAAAATAVGWQRGWAAGYAAGRKGGYGQGRDDEANGEDLPEWYRLATGEICRPGQPYGCGDFHHNGKCVRERHDA